MGVNGRAAELIRSTSNIRASWTNTYGVSDIDHHGNTSRLRFIVTATFPPTNSPRLSELQRDSRRSRKIQKELTRIIRRSENPLKSMRASDFQFCNLLLD